ncbi:MAG: DUF2271 domain-containing protein [Chitinivibrionales bacterium]|nr:DUF2271 domain-containing protein [Chitinivibrionales bacterium]
MIKRTVCVLAALLLCVCGEPTSTFVHAGRAKVGSRPGVTVSVTTRTYGGEYAPANCLGVWIEDADSSFVTSLALYGNVPEYLMWLLTWRISSGTNILGVSKEEVDGWTAASRVDHGTVVETAWDLRDSNGDPVPPGLYTLYVEMTESNALGKTVAVDLPIDGTGRTVTAGATEGFQSVVAHYIP